MTIAENDSSESGVKKIEAPGPKMDGIHFEAYKYLNIVGLFHATEGFNLWIITTTFSLPQLLTMTAPCSNMSTALKSLLGRQ
jgi:hypothetical protein